ncbi:MAG: mechanosensitive ion channel family protein [Anaerolineae bacterium]
MPLFERIQDILLEVGIGLLWLVVSAVAAWLGVQFIDRWVRRLTRRSSTRIDDLILAAVRPLVFIYIVLIGLRLAIGGLNFAPPQWAPIIDDVFFVAYFLAGYILTYRLVTGLITWYADEMAVKTETTLDEQVLPFFRRVALIVVSLIAVVIFLSHFGVDASAVVTTLGVGSLAVALAAQSALADTIAGFMIMLDRPYRIGDRVEIQEINTWGDVLDIGLRTTRIRTRDNRLVVVPNSVISKNLIVNHSIPSTMFRVQTHVGVAYGSDIDRVRQVLIEAVRAQEWVMKDQRIEALFLEFGDSSLNFRVRCWIEHYVETRRILDKLNGCLYNALQEAGIEIPFPQRVVHLPAGSVMPSASATDN